MSESIYHSEVLFKLALLWNTAFFMFFAGLMAFSLKHDKCTAFLKRLDGDNIFLSNPNRRHRMVQIQHRIGSIFLHF